MLLPLAMTLGGIVARNIRRLRLERGLTQEALAVDAGIDRTYVSRLERGLVNPSVAVLEKLARALASNIEEFFTAPRAGEGTAPPRLPFMFCSGREVARCPPRRKT